MLSTKGAASERSRRIEPGLTPVRTFIVMAFGVAYACANASHVRQPSPLMQPNSRQSAGPLTPESPEPTDLETEENGLRMLGPLRRASTRHLENTVARRVDPACVMQYRAPFAPVGSSHHKMTTLEASSKPRPLTDAWLAPIPTSLTTSWDAASIDARCRYRRRRRTTSNASPARPAAAHSPVEP